jgi:hypothetical protein
LEANVFNNSFLRLLPTGFLMVLFFLVENNSGFIFISLFIKYLGNKEIKYRRNVWILLSYLKVVRKSVSLHLDLRLKAKDVRQVLAQSNVLNVTAIAVGQLGKSGRFAARSRLLVKRRNVDLPIKENYYT